MTILECKKPRLQNKTQLVTVLLYPLKNVDLCQGHKGRSRDPENPLDLRDSRKSNFSKKESKKTAIKV